MHVTNEILKTQYSISIPIFHNIHCFHIKALGERLALDDPRLGQFREWTRMFTESMDMGGDLDAFPALRYLGHKQYKQLCEVKRLREEQLCPYLEKAKVCTPLGL